MNFLKAVHLICESAKYLRSIKHRLEPWTKAPIVIHPTYYKPEIWCDSHFPDHFRRAGYSTLVRRDNWKEFLRAEKLSRDEQTTELELMQVSATVLQETLSKIKNKFPKAKMTPGSHENAKVLLGLGASPAEVLALFSDNHTLLQQRLSYVNNADAILDKARLFTSTGYSRKEFFSLCLKQPAVLRNDIHFAREILYFIRNELNMSSGTDLIRCSPWFRVSLETLKRNMEFLNTFDPSILQAMLRIDRGLICWNPHFVKERMPVWKSYFGTDLEGLIQRWPRLLIKDPAILIERVENLKSLFGVRDTSVLLKQIPYSLLIASQETVQESFARCIALLGKERAVALVRAYPAMLSKSWSTWGPKFEFIQAEMGRDLDEIAMNPAVLTYSLAKRIRPRHLKISSINPSHKSSLHFLMLSNERFDIYCKRLAKMDSAALETLRERARLKLQRRLIKARGGNSIPSLSDFPAGELENGNLSDVQSMRDC